MPEKPLWDGCFDLTSCIIWPLSSASLPAYAAHSNIEKRKPGTAAFFRDGAYPRGFPKRRMRLSRSNSCRLQRYNRPSSSRSLQRFCLGFPSYRAASCFVMTNVTGCSQRMPSSVWPTVNAGVDRRSDGEIFSGPDTWRSSRRFAARTSSLRAFGSPRFPR